ncbi:MAG: hypothetical protein NZM04_06375 [Methylacidiphilales bacterium]|nr:hypothetical protein [Candidatus Methylacidiphilales bacterium]MDW8350238.1 hypothetical protein [Verrucomicrobiae bacterium]
MNWQLYRWTWQLQSPLYIGSLPAGPINRTRLYLPASTLRGAITSQLLTPSPTHNPYRHLGFHILRHTRLTYLYPSIHYHGEWLAFLPRYAEPDNPSHSHGLTWTLERHPQISIPHLHFRSLLLTTIPSTAIDPLSDTAQEATLRSIEAISPHIPLFKHSRLALTGYLLIPPDDPITQKILDLHVLHIGGDRRYGLGILHRTECRPIHDPSPTLFHHTATIDLTTPHPTLTTTHLLAHTRLPTDLQPPQPFPYRPYGALEALARWSYQRALRRRPPLWTPGTLLLNITDSSPSSHTTRPPRLAIKPNGLWQTLPTA